MYTVFLSHCFWYCCIVSIVFLNVFNYYFSFINTVLGYTFLFILIFFRVWSYAAVSPFSLYSLLHFQHARQPFWRTHKINFAQCISCHARAQSFTCFQFNFLFFSGDSFCCICAYSITCGYKACFLAGSWRGFCDDCNVVVYSCLEFCLDFSNTFSIRIRIRYSV